MSLPTNKTVAVVGAGAMGQGIAQVAAEAGHPVLLFDAADGQAAAAAERLGRVFARLVEKGKRTQADADAVLKRVTPVATLEDLAPAALIVEAVVERLDVKQEVFGKLEEICGADAILATNTSSLSITAIARPLKRPARVVGMHFFNPAPLLPLVEVVSGLSTDPEVADLVFDTAAAWGKSPVFATSTPGFIVNRVARPFYGEGLRIVEEGAADPATVDACIRDAGGFRMGPFELMDLIGNDVNYSVSAAVFEAFSYDPRYRPSVLQKEMADGGLLGRKSGRGWYDYAQEAERPEPPEAETADIAPPDAAILLGEPGPWSALFERLAEAGLQIERQEDDCLFPLLDFGPVILCPTDGAHAESIAEAEGKPAIVMDLALDWTKAGRIALARSSNCPAEDFARVAALFQAAGMKVSPVEDVPGLIVARTAAMLMNEACDALYKGVSDPEGIDTAMKKGVNYPIGPLAWADRLGHARVLEILDNLCDSYREERYRPCALWRRLPEVLQFREE
ncbi:MAG: 3-hydroxyacyl-CoA dehydrogenase [Marivibrio sp.]|uniref:3-hydroxyacyl-CoA dehydrogenase n=1 Tax=Marivibrio sp. TaxID=2039719 RepID=UPI0032ED0371